MIYVNNDLNWIITSIPTFCNILKFADQDHLTRAHGDALRCKVYPRNWVILRPNYLQ